MDLVLTLCPPFSPENPGVAGSVADDPTMQQILLGYMVHVALPK